MSRLWDKGIELDQRVLAYTAGEDYALDERLVKYDVRASIAHAEMLNARKLLVDADLEAIRDGLTAIGDAHGRGEWKIELADEDGQTALEKRLTARIGAAGGRVHLGRSRNDQVLTSIRLLPNDARYLPATINNTLVQVNADGRSARVNGEVLLPENVPSATLVWVTGTAHDESGRVVGVRRWEWKDGLAPGRSLPFGFMVSSLGGRIERIEFAVEARP